MLKKKLRRISASRLKNRNKRLKKLIGRLAMENRRLKSDLKELDDLVWSGRCPI